MCGYGVIPVGYTVSFACCPEMRDGHNCVIAASPEALARRLAHVCADRATRAGLAAAAIETRRNDLSPERLLTKYRRVLEFPNV